MNVLMSGQSSKFMVALLAAVAGALPQYFGTARWEPIVVYALGALGVFLVPNSTQAPVVPPPAPAAAPVRAPEPPPG